MVDSLRKDAVADIVLIDGVDSYRNRPMRYGMIFCAAGCNVYHHTRTNHDMLLDVIRRHWQLLNDKSADYRLRLRLREEIHKLQYPNAR